MGNHPGPATERSVTTALDGAPTRGATVEEVPAPAVDGVTATVRLLTGGDPEGPPALRRLAPVQRQQAVLGLQRTVGNAAVQRLLRDQIDLGPGSSGSEPMRRWPDATRRQDAPSERGDRAADLDADGRSATGTIRSVPPIEEAATAPPVQRAPVAAPPAADQASLADVQRKQRIEAKKRESLTLDKEWGDKFNERLSSYKQAVLRVSRGLETANQGFQSAQVAQAQIDQLKIQVIGLVGTALFAAAFEWIAKAALGKLSGPLNLTPDKIKGMVEKAENPANAMVAGTVNVVAAGTAKASTDQGQTPATGGRATGVPGGTPVAGGGIGSNAMIFLTGKLEALEHHNQLLLKAFIARTAEANAMTDDAWERWDRTAQANVYEKLLEGLIAAGSGVEEMKDGAEVARIIERHMWALWIQGMNKEVEADVDRHTEGGATDIDAGPKTASYGSYIEDELNAVGVSKLALVTLTGHWYSSNSPNGWETMLGNWARDYKESISTKV